ncbi:MAG TPA: hypothetical protein H9902_14000 [Candidatus Stackebrandtia faecavium]|nr:hypothetical protein [Candidatus Stackebrandtia faecavium]
MISKIFDDADSRMVLGVSNGRLPQALSTAGLLSPVSSFRVGRPAPLCLDTGASYEGTTVSARKPGDQVSGNATNEGGAAAGVITDVDGTRGLPPRKRPVYRWG